MTITFLCHNKQQHDAAWQLGLDLGFRPATFTSTYKGRSNVCLKLSKTGNSMSEGSIDWPKSNNKSWDYGTIIDLEAPSIRIPGIPYDITIGDTDVKIGCQTFSKTAILALAKEVK